MKTALTRACAFADRNFDYVGIFAMIFVNIIGRLL